jgi:nicotinate-nucleotide adenylyltransferase
MHKQKTNTRIKRIGIYSGTFNPVHAGHVSFALQAAVAAQLDAVYFLPERRPRNKQSVEHFAHRVAMLKRAVALHRRLHVLELEHVNFTVAATLPRLQKRFPKAELVFLMGSDVVPFIATWPNSTQLLKQCGLVVGVRAADNAAIVQESIQRWQVQPTSLAVIESHAAHVSSRKIREALQRREYIPGILRSVERYSSRNWLYISLA